MVLFIILLNWIIVLLNLGTHIPHKSVSADTFPMLVKRKRDLGFLRCIHPFQALEIKDD